MSSRMRRAPGAAGQSEGVSGACGSGALNGRRARSRKRNCSLSYWQRHCGAPPGQVLRSCSAQTTPRWWRRRSRRDRPGMRRSCRSCEPYNFSPRASDSPGARNTSRDLSIPLRTKSHATLLARRFWRTLRRCCRSRLPSRRRYWSCCALQPFHGTRPSGVSSFYASCPGSGRLHAPCVHLRSTSLQRILRARRTNSVPSRRTSHLAVLRQPGKMDYVIAQ